MASNNSILSGNFTIQSKPQRELRRGAFATNTSTASNIEHNDGVLTNKSVITQSTGEAPALDEESLNFKYEDHTADVRVRTTTTSFKNCLRALGYGLVGYMTELSSLTPRLVRNIIVEADSMKLAIFHFLDEVLFLYGSEYFMTCRIEITRMSVKQTVLSKGGADEEANDPVVAQILARNEFQVHHDEDELTKSYIIHATCWGECFNDKVHQQGTEVKAITMHFMHLEINKDNSIDCAVLLDI